MKSINHDKLKKHLILAYKTKQPMFIHGTFGIGKSQNVEETSRWISKEIEHREYVNWNDLTEAEKEKFVSNQETIKKYFIMFDTRASECDTTDTKGIVNFTSNKNYLVWVNDIIWRVFENENSRGVIFFDELNLAPPLIQASFYKIINDCKVGNIKINKHILRVGAGNRIEDKCGIMEMATALKNRFKHYELSVPTTEDYTSYGLAKNFHSSIIPFLNFKSSRLFNFDNKNKDHSIATPRTWERLSIELNALNENEISDTEYVEEIVSSWVGDAVAMEMMAFLQLNKKINVEDILRNPKSIREFEKIDLKYAVIGCMSEYYKKHKDVKVLDGICHVCKEMDAEFGVLQLRMIRAIDDKFFVKELPKLKVWNDISKNYAKYLI